MESGSFIPVIAISVTIISAVWGHALWLGGQFKNVDEKFAKILTTINEKLEYHERHDDQRFNHISDNIWELRLSQALSTGYPINATKKAIRTEPRTGGEETGV
jgi:hypothetical protein